MAANKLQLPQIKFPFELKDAIKRLSRHEIGCLYIISLEQKH